MDKQYAINLIRELFENSFQKDKFVFFIKNLLNHIEDASFLYRGAYIPGIFQGDIKTIERIGKYQDINGKLIDILVITFLRDETLERARSLQRNIIAWYLNGGRGGKMKDAALVAFISPNNQDWRFSFVKMEYKYDSEAKKIKESYTPAKRYSYLVGPQEASHTAQSMMLPVLLNDKINPTLEEIEAIFKIEKVTKEFFEKYKDLFLNLADQFSKNQEFEQKVVREHKVQVADFVKKLMGQIVFLYFLQKKGWLGVKPGEKWGSGDKKFMHNLFHKKYCEYENFYNDVLEPLFYNTLNNRDRQNSSVINDQSYSPFFKCRIPYLNGGLFTPVYDWIKSKIFIDNKYFQDIFDVFDTFNFTVFESDPIEKEVAVDPEMLGMVFENLLEIRDRKSKGAFYTPREIVHYMCQESLVNYLISQSGYSEDRIRKLMNSKDQEVARTEKDKERIENNQDLKDVAEIINNLLKTVKICDPAVGSGAFPMGLLKEISTTRYFLNKHFLKERNRNNELLTEYDIKKETLENCIYGVDIDSGAVEIARLRFWLSLVVEHDIEEIEPLPNLDYKIMQGNSLIELLSPTLTLKTTDENRNKLIDRLKFAKAEYFNLSTTSTKSVKREEINILTRNLINYDKEKERNKLYGQIQDKKNQLRMFSLGNEQQTIADADFYSKLNSIKDFTDKDHFEWHLNFNEVFEGGGFDIVIGNPPYVGEKGNKDTFRSIAKGNLKDFYMRKMDLFYFFFHLALNLGDKVSQISFITTDYFPTADGAFKLRLDLKSRSSIKKLIDFKELKIFESAMGQHNLISIFSKSSNRSDIVDTCIVNKAGIATTRDLEEILNWKDNQSNYYRFQQSFLYEGDDNQIRLNGSIQSSSSISNQILKKVLNNHCKLQDYCYINMGVQSGADFIGAKLIERALEKGYINNNFLRENLMDVGDGIYVVNEKIAVQFSDQERFDILKPFIKNSDIHRYFIDLSDKYYYLYLDSHTDIKNYPNIERYLIKFRPILKAREQVKNEDNSWYRMRGSKRKYFINTGLHILCPYRAKKNIFALSEGNIIGAGDVYYITQKSDELNFKYLVSLLNSKLYHYWLINKGKKKGDVLELYQKPLSDIPIKYISKNEQNSFVHLVDKILQVTKGSDYLTNQTSQNNVNILEKQIDQMVYKLYKLTPEEIQIIESETQ